LTLAGHGVNFGSADVDAMQTEIENEEVTGTMPLNPVPTTSVTITDYAPDYNAAPPPPVLSTPHFTAGGSFTFTITPLTPGTTNYLQVSSGLTPGAWQTIATFVPNSSSYTFVEPVPATNQQRFYRWFGQP
jgi:hypothetical protein